VRSANVRDDLAALFDLEGDDFTNAVLGNARAIAGSVRELDDTQRQRLLGVLEQTWPEGGFANSFTRDGSTISASDGGAFVWLFLGPELDAPLTPDRWADVARSGVVMTDTAEWLRKHYAAEGAALAATTDAREARVWFNLIESIPTATPLPDELVGSLVHHLDTLTEGEPDFEMWHIGERLAEEGRLDALLKLSEKSQEIERRLLPWRAKAGDPEAARRLLEEMIDGLRERKRIDRGEAEWLEGVNAPELLPLLFAGLEAEVDLAHDDPFSVRGGLQRAIHRIGGEEAVRLYDELIDKSEDSRFKFLRIPRDDLVQSELRRAGQEVAPLVAGQLGLPFLQHG
jgi:hypothetical protein